jgi:hypothetical protein
MMSSICPAVLVQRENEAGINQRGKIPPYGRGFFEAWESIDPMGLIFWAA